MGNVGMRCSFRGLVSIARHGGRASASSHPAASVSRIRIASRLAMPKNVCQDFLTAVSHRIPKPPRLFLCFPKDYLLGMGVSVAWKWKADKYRHKIGFA